MSSPGRHPAGPERPPAAGGPGTGAGCGWSAVSSPSPDPRRPAWPRWRRKAAQLRRLELEVTRRLDGLLSGEFLGVAAGPGTEPAGARPYAAGDDARRIDWSLTARAVDAHVRTTEPDRELETWVVADRSASLDFGTTEREKRELVLAAVAAFGFLTIGGGNRLGLVITGGERVTRVEAASTRVPACSPRCPVCTTSRAATTNRPPVPTWQPGCRRSSGSTAAGARSWSCPTSSTPADWATPLRRLGLRHQVVAVQVVDRRELELPAVGILSVVDTETGRQMDVQTNSAGLRARYAAAADAAQRHHRGGHPGRRRRAPRRCSPTATGCSEVGPVRRGPPGPPRRSSPPGRVRRRSRDRGGSGDLPLARVAPPAPRAPRSAGRLHPGPAGPAQVQPSGSPASICWRRWHLAVPAGSGTSPPWPCSARSPCSSSGSPIRRGPRRVARQRATVDHGHRHLRVDGVDRRGAHEARSPPRRRPAAS